MEESKITVHIIFMVWYVAGCRLVISFDSLTRRAEQGRAEMESHAMTLNAPSPTRH